MGAGPTAGNTAGLLEFKGNLDCSANPNYPAGEAGDAYYVSAAGKVGGASGKSVEVGDQIICKADAATGDEAAVGTSWFVAQANTALATQAEAEAGANNTALMTPLRAAQAIAALATGDTIDLGPTIAWVITAANGGSDVTGECGNPAKPYATMSAAYDAGARVFFLGEGTFAGISKAGAVSISVFGAGSARTTITLVESTNEGAISVVDLGVWSATLTTVGKNGSDGAEYASGGVGTTVSLTNAYVVTLAAHGGSGGTGIGDASPGGNGGNAGAVQLSGRTYVATVNASGGAGGEGGATQPSGNGGNSGSITMEAGCVIGTLNNDAGAPGTSNGGGPGAWGTHGGFSGHFARVGSASFASDGMTESSIIGAFNFIESVTNGTPDTASVKASYINGLWIEN